MTEHGTQKFAYEIVGNSAVIYRCFSRIEKAEIPREIAGCPVTKIAPYAFSDHMDIMDLKGVCYTSQEELPVLCGNRLEEIWIPDTVTQVGRYCFYDCNNIKKISFTDALRDWGSGAFTGCHHVEQLEIHIYKDGRSTLKDVLMELPELMTVDYYLKTGSETRFARLVFPEFFEEGVENTPARLLGNRMHGSGMHYRNCFQQRVFRFAEYDSRFTYAGFHENFKVLAEMALGRLRYPLELSEGARRQYERFVVDEKEKFSRYMIEKKETDTLIWYTELLVGIPEITKEELGGLLSLMTELASALSFQEGLSYLMDYQHRHGRKKQKMSFDL